MTNLKRPNKKRLAFGNATLEPKRVANSASRKPVKLHSGQRDSLILSLLLTCSLLLYLLRLDCMKKHYISNKLFAEPSFIEGGARLLDFGNTLQEYNASETDAETDIESLKNDWRAIGDDIKISIERYEQLAR